LIGKIANDPQVVGRAASHLAQRFRLRISSIWSVRIRHLRLTERRVTEGAVEADDKALRSHI
jgi:hypothetical protein